MQYNVIQTYYEKVFRGQLECCTIICDENSYTLYLQIIIKLTIHL